MVQELSILPQTEMSTIPVAAYACESVKAGVSQGSFLGPLLFLIYINDSVVDIHSCIRQFADDTRLYTLYHYLQPSTGSKFY